MCLKRSMPGCLFLGVSFATAMGAPPEFHDVVTDDAPILWYQFGEPAGTAIATNHGSLGSAYNGTYFNGVALGIATSSGDTGACFEWGMEQYVESGSAAPTSMRGNPTFTAETVVFVPADAAATSWPPFLHWGGPTTGNSVYFSLQRNRRHIVYVGFYNGGLRSECSINLDEWNHFVWTRDSGGGTNGQYDGTTLYVNGEPVSLVVDTDLPGAPVINVTSSAFRVQRAQSSFRYFDGIMDEVMLYDRLLTPEEITEHFTSLGITPTECVAEFDDNCGVTSDDFFAFIEAYLGGDADVNDDGETNSNDFFVFLAAFFAGC